MSGLVGNGTDALKRGGHRLTPQRQLILQVLDRAGHHLSAEDICEQVQITYPSMSLSTVYRTLDLLARLGLVLEARLSSDRRVYELAREEGEHTHLICRDCGAVSHPTALDPRRLSAQLTAETGYDTIAVEVVATGRCPVCAAANRAAGSASASRAR